MADINSNNTTENLEVEDILEEIILLRYKHRYSNKGVTDHLKNKYKLTQSRCYHLIKLARIRIGEFHRKINENVLEDALMSLEEMLFTAHKEKNRKLELEIQKELNKINSLYIETVNHNIVEQPLFIDPDSETNEE